MKQNNNPTPNQAQQTNQPNTISNPAQLKQEPDILIDSVRVGDVTLSSSSLNANDLANLLVEMLGNDSIKSYLDLVKSDREKKKAGYCG